MRTTSRNKCLWLLSRSSYFGRLDGSSWKEILLLFHKSSQIKEGWVLRDWSAKCTFSRLHVNHAVDRKQNGVRKSNLEGKCNNAIFSLKMGFSFSVGFFTRIWWLFWLECVHVKILCYAMCKIYVLANPTTPHWGYPRFSPTRTGLGYFFRFFRFVWEFGDFFEFLGFSGSNRDSFEFFGFLIFGFMDILDFFWAFWAFLNFRDWKCFGNCFGFLDFLEFFWILWIFFGFVWFGGFFLHIWDFLGIYQIFGISLGIFSDF